MCLERVRIKYLHHHTKLYGPERKWFYPQFLLRNIIVVSPDEIIDALVPDIVTEY